VPNKKTIEKDGDCNPNLYLPSCCKPPDASEKPEQSLRNFTEKLKEITEHNTTNSTPKSNLTKLHKNYLRKFYEQLTIRSLPLRQKLTNGTQYVL
jgi:hypothetical protein